ncbi:transporter [Flavobacterium sp. DGU11]|uniref:Transporter n=1 Tax=Flavobacterium arundinis TaxID=3139143 RepID=A0ABU9I063_9FLAO
MLYNRFMPALFFCFFAPDINAQEEIETDRPDHTETASIVPAGRFQAESGFEYTKAEKGSKEFFLPETLWKFGLNDRTELRLITQLSYNKYYDTIYSGLSPVTVGFKVNLFKEKGVLPETSFIAHLVLPKVASKDFKASLLAPELLFLFDNELSDKASLGYNIGVKWDGESPDAMYAYTFSPDFKLTDTFKAFVESFGYLPEHHHPQHWVDGGFIWLLNSNLQLDIAAGYELTSNQHFHSYFETVGVSFRI